MAFVFCAFVYPFYIKWLRDKQIGQFIRQEGPASHAVKAKTPTMGGLCFIAGTVLAGSLAIYCFGSGNAVPAGGSTPGLGIGSAVLALAAAVFCGLLGFADDYGKITSRSNTGLSARLRLACEFSLGLALGLGLNFVSETQHSAHIVTFLGLGSNAPPQSLPCFDLAGVPFLDPLYKFVLVPFIMAATSNALNLHDGMDGLAGSTSLTVFLSLAIMLALIPGCAALSWTAAAAAGALLAFLIYNRYPAKVFMGDTGSLFLGALMAGLVVSGGLLLWFIPMALIYIMEAISVISQVVYFKLSKPYEPAKPMSALSLAIFKLTHRLPGEGKRLWRMAPMHHHFEAVAAEKGIKEWQVVLCFFLAQLLLCSICLAAFHFAV